jgi:hypothetical protein
VSGQLNKEAPLPDEVKLTEHEKGDWRRFLAAFEFSKKNFAAAQTALKRRDDERSGLLQERADVEMCFVLLGLSYWPSRWTGGVRYVALAFRSRSAFPANIRSSLRSR